MQPQDTVPVEGENVGPAVIGEIAREDALAVRAPARADLAARGVGGRALLVHAIEVEGDSALQSGVPINSAMTAILLAYGANPDLELNGYSPRKTADSHGHDMAIKLLERHGGRMK
ncbi:MULTISPECIES: ankyrin repeat domain-containing protein [unclassified Streptomyces]|uniref:ankyrin repeat domain-containing protein n=1 Tax=unclassified Streptomyces TaxID=2593676 RepID=UPI00166122B7|nr:MULTISPECIES: ankyrin repeat domain-containing protein [unclassified Streptomyces]